MFRITLLVSAITLGSALASTRPLMAQSPAAANARVYDQTMYSVHWREPGISYDQSTGPFNTKAEAEQQVEAIATYYRNRRKTLDKIWIKEGTYRITMPATAPPPPQSAPLASRPAAQPGGPFQYQNLPSTDPGAYRSSTARTPGSGAYNNPLNTNPIAGTWHNKHNPGSSLVVTGDQMNWMGTYYGKYTQAGNKIRATLQQPSIPGAYVTMDGTLTGNTLHVKWSRTYNTSYGQKTDDFGENEFEK